MLDNCLGGRSISDIKRQRKRALGGELCGKVVHRGLCHIG
ncbi:hypothetical protein CBM2634_B120006 [Cupriavidus taiwanensis]|uniref:Uncharacterized protein n=1 Tax=Cupriavidus taiwanensis TaxID=164546 RepID=A0A375J853_9BURK|nr:hypothetical protein CBM2634_B120006 [Cupriavidus taiwanensis]